MVNDCQLSIDIAIELQSGCEFDIREKYASIWVRMHILYILALFKTYVPFVGQ